MDATVFHSTPFRRINPMFSRRTLMTRLALGAVALAAAPAALAQTGKTTLFKVVTTKDEIIIGLSEAELKDFGGADAGAVAKALAQKGTLTVWQYNVKRGANNEFQQAPSAKIGLIANSSLRVEPYSTPYTIVAHD
jgi:hypothetical protein